MPTKTCPNGHVMDDSWPQCPYCQGIDGIGQSSFSRTEPTDTVGRTHEMQTQIIGTEVISPGGKYVTQIRHQDAGHQQHFPIAGWLVLTEGIAGANLGIDHTIRTGKTTLGRNPKSNIVLKDDYSSDNHAAIVVFENKCFIRDAGSTNGTFVNEERVLYGAERELKDDDLIRIGETRFVFKGLY